MKSLFLFCSCLVAAATRAQSGYSVASLPDSLRQNANAVVRLDLTEVSIGSQRDMRTKYKRAVTVFNEKGLSTIQGIESYSKRKSVKNIYATVYDASGKEIKKIRRKDFRDVSSSGGAMFYSEDRILYLDYTPVQYPFTLVFECETQTSNTAFIMSWTPVDGFFTGVEKSVFKIMCAEQLGLRKKEFNFEGFPVSRQETAAGVTYTALQIPAQKPETMCPSYSKVFPRVIFGLEHFNLEGVDGSARTWNEFGKWYSEKILAGTDALPEAISI